MQSEITEADVTAALDRAGLRFQVRGRYIVSQCPKHEERNPSCQIFLDDFFCSCLAGCGRFPITDAFPELRRNTGGKYIPQERRTKIETVPRYKEYDLMEDFLRLPLIPRDHTFKNLPLETLDELGWRWDEGRNSYFIPYFSQDRKSVPFCQWRHLSGSRRFTFLTGARPTLYGKWNICPGARLFIVEGTSDAAVLERCGVPWVGVPSASSGGILKNFAIATRGQVELVYAGDRDVAGDALRAVLDDCGAAYRAHQVPEKYKDWGEFYEDEGDLAVFEWCKPKLEE